LVALFARKSLRAVRMIIEADPGAAPFYERMGAHYAGFAPSKSIPGRMLPRMQMELEALSLPLAPLMPESPGRPSRPPSRISLPRPLTPAVGVLVGSGDPDEPEAHEPEPTGVVVVLESSNLNQERDPLQSDSRRASASKGLARRCRAWSDQWHSVADVHCWGPGAPQCTPVRNRHARHKA
jgi:hypothetical protein